MNKITIAINTKNDAFQDGNLNIETARLLRKLADWMDNGRLPNSLNDINGNKAVTVEFE